MSHNPAPPERWLYRLAEVRHLLGVSRATVYRLVRDGRLDARKIGSATRITADSIDRYVASLPRVGDPAA